ncbi:hypothetical protein CYMTET_34340 [Cymbomonas tetramitiformis]|uniref:Uncharacterized protein n=1 Tax=Cymbomonas tetramitiformis TaxID=36881 RepID=A0AAE0FBB1_9CHLO|nr:hypothetical protein CYMTET_34340 [Cymbomonas tetramitiformis]
MWATARTFQAVYTLDAGSCGSRTPQQDTYYGRVLELTLEGPPLAYPGEYDELVTEDEPLHAAGSGTPSHTLSQLHPVQQQLQTLRDGLLNSIQRSAAIGNITPATNDTDSQVGDVQQASPFRLVPEALADLRLQRFADPVAPVDEKYVPPARRAALELNKPARKANAPVGTGGGASKYSTPFDDQVVNPQLAAFQEFLANEATRLQHEGLSGAPMWDRKPERRIAAEGVVPHAPGHGAFGDEDPSINGPGAAAGGGGVRLSLVPGLNCYRVVVTKGEPSTEFMIAYGAWAEVCQLLVQARPFVRAAFNTGLKAVKLSNWEMDTYLFRCASRWRACRKETPGDSASRWRACRKETPGDSASRWRACRKETPGDSASRWRACRKETPGDSA